MDQHLKKKDFLGWIITMKEAIFQVSDFVEGAIFPEVIFPEAIFIGGIFHWEIFQGGSDPFKNCG